MPYVPVTELSQYVGKALGHSAWLKIDQQRINCSPRRQAIFSSSMSTLKRRPKPRLAAPSPMVF